MKLTLLAIVLIVVEAMITVTASAMAFVQFASGDYLKGGLLALVALIAFAIGVFIFRDAREDRKD